MKEQNSLEEDKASDKSSKTTDNKDLKKSVLDINNRKQSERNGR